MQKCRYYNDCQTASSLMLDDFSLTAVAIDNTIMPFNDWGYNLDRDNSICRYFEDNLLAKYPEIKGTIFIPISKHALPNRNAGYNILQRAVDKDFKGFASKIFSKFELAFHGTTHGKYIDENNPELDNNWKQEFEYLTLDDASKLKKSIGEFEKLLGIKFSGGKYPGYMGSKVSEELLKELGFLWWASSSDMVNKKSGSNHHSYIDNQIIEIPTNFYGNTFNSNLFDRKSWKNSLKRLRKFARGLKAEKYLQYLYDNRYPITVQEHFQNMRTDGQMQVPNIFSDINSLDKIYSLLRNSDIWHATCEEVAHYLESYDFTEIKKEQDSTYKVKYNGNWKKPFISVKSACREIFNLDTNKKIHGFYKNGMWIFNNIEEGTYKEV